MPAIHETYPCHVCGKTHVLFFVGDAAPELGRQFFYVCPSNGFAVRITTAEGWSSVETKPQGALQVMGTELSNRAGQ